MNLLGKISVVVILVILANLINDYLEIKEHIDNARGSDLDACLLAVEDVSVDYDNKGFYIKVLYRTYNNYNYGAMTIEDYIKTQIEPNTRVICTPLSGSFASRR